MPSLFTVKTSRFEHELLIAERALIREEIQERRLQNIVLFLSAAVVVNVLSRALYFWHVYRVWEGKCRG